MTNQNNAAQPGQDPIYDAIFILTEEADSLSECHTRTPGDWAGEPEAKARYDHILAVVDALSKLRAPVADERQPDGKRPDLDWIEGVCVTDTVGRGWCVRIDGTDIFEDVNRYGCKGRRSFQIAADLPSKQEAERAAVEWLDRQRAALASTPVADESEAKQVAKWKRDSELLDAVQDGCWDVRFLSSPNGDAGDSSIGVEIVSHFMAAPRERVIGENWNENLRSAIEQAMTADSYPSAQPKRASAPVAEPETMEEIHRRERERAPWVLPKDPTLPASAPVADQAGDTLTQVYDAFGIGVLARTPSTLMACLGNVIRRAHCLSQVEQVLSVPTPPEPEDDGIWGEESLLRWGADEKGYAEHFRAALAEWSRRTALASATVAGEARPTDWQEALRICELPEVDEALANFCDDGTQDNAVGLVLAVLNAAPQASAEDVRNAALEEAAVIVETAPDYLQDSTFDGAARAIRAIKTPGAALAAQPAQEEGGSDA